MSLSLIEAILGGSFVLIWLFIAGMIFRDGRFAIRDEAESEVFRTHGGHATPARPHADFRKDAGRKDRRTSAA
jgi:hypothetical protein